MNGENLVNMLIGSNGRPGTGIRTRKMQMARHAHLQLLATQEYASRTAVEHLQHMTQPTFEVECELVDETGSYLETHTDAAIAKSILLKSHLLLGDVTLGAEVAARGDGGAELALAVHEVGDRNHRRAGFLDAGAGVAAEAAVGVQIDDVAGDVVGDRRRLLGVVAGGS